MFYYNNYPQESNDPRNRWLNNIAKNNNPLPQSYRQKLHNFQHKSCLSCQNTCTINKNSDKCIRCVMATNK